LTKKEHRCEKCCPDDELSEQDLIDIEQAKKDIKDGKYYTTKQLKKKLGLK